jgi:hypothetical protein
MFSKRKIQYDIWLFFDIISGAVNIAAFNIIGGATPDEILDINGIKRYYDYYMILVLVISWLRFFSYFLVIKSVSKVTITLFYMLYETVSFLVILSFYLILMTTVFATMFRDVPTDDA